MTQHLWHPCSQMKDYEIFAPLIIKRARGSHIELENGQQLIDAISSWWCKSLGHQHPVLKAALLEQLDKFEHVIFANTTNDVAIRLAEKLAAINPVLSKVFFAGDGSCAVEIAMKMSIHARAIAGQTKRTQFIALANGYHGETAAAMSVSDVGIYRDPYQPLLFEPHFIEDIPYVSGVDDPLWHDASEHWQRAEAKLAPLAEQATALIFEPIVQGAGGMKIYSADFLKRLCAWAKADDIHIIADEIMTGVGRTGTMLACEHADVTPDFVCLSKGLTSGFMPFSTVLTTDAIYDLFYDDYETGKAFLHSHTYSGHPLGATVALATLDVIEQEKILPRAAELTATLRDNMQAVAQNTGKLDNIRAIGAMVAADLTADAKPDVKRLGYAIYQEAVKRGALLRPLGNTLYWLPPLNIELSTLQQLQRITEDSIHAVCG